MSRFLNRITLIGTIGRDPEMRYTPTGRPVTSFSLATSRNWKSPEGEQHTETEWFNVIAWGDLAEIAKKILRKGRWVYVDGRLQTRRWESADGQKHISVEVVVNDLILLEEPKGLESTTAEDAELDQASRINL